MIKSRVIIYDRCINFPRRHTILKEYKPSNIVCRYVRPNLMKPQGQWSNLLIEMGTSTTLDQSLTNPEGKIPVTTQWT